MSFPDGSEIKASACNAGDPGSIPESGRSPGEGNGNPLQYSCLENPMDEEAGRLQSMGSQRVRHDWATSLTHSLHFSYFLFYKLIHKPQEYLNCINAKLLLQACFPINFEFLYFLIFFPFFFYPYLYSLGLILSYNVIHIHICRPKQAKSWVGRTKAKWITGTWMKGLGPCYSSWMLCSRITFPCPSVYPPHPGLPWLWKILQPVEFE